NVTGVQTCALPISANICSISLSVVFLLPTSNNTPTIILTILYKKPFPRKINVISSSFSSQRTSFNVLTLLPFTVDLAEQKDVKSCVPSNSLQACCIFSICNGYG